MSASIDDLVKDLRAAQKELSRLRGCITDYEKALSRVRVDYEGAVGTLAQAQRDLLAAASGES